MSLKIGSKVIGQKYEFEGVAGVILQHPCKNLFIVKFEGCNIPVLTTRNNLIEVKDDYLC